jgi:hypothetical protein
MENDPNTDKPWPYNTSRERLCRAQKIGKMGGSLAVGNVAKHDQPDPELAPEEQDEDITPHYESPD